MLKHTLTLLLLLLTLTAGAQDYSKMSPSLRQRLSQRLSQRTVQTKGVRSTGNTPIINVFVECDDNSAEQYCVKHAGNIHILSADEETLAEISNYPGIKRMEASFHTMEAHLDTTNTIIGSTKIWEGNGLPQAFDGKGVIVGDLDTGQDYSHPTFRSTADGHLRIVRAWDWFADVQETMKTGTTFPLGVLYTDTAAIIKAEASGDGATAYHGTHTASTAAGSGWGSAYRGVAPEADIYMVSVALSNNNTIVHSMTSTATAALAFSNVFDYADSIGKPCVINYSVGSIETYEQMAESELYEKFLENISGPGKIIVVSAGNDYKFERNGLSITPENPVGGGYMKGLPSSTFIAISKGHVTLKLHAINIKTDETATLPIPFFGPDELKSDTTITDSIPEVMWIQSKNSIVKSDGDPAVAHLMSFCMKNYNDYICVLEAVGEDGAYMDLRALGCEWGDLSDIDVDNAPFDCKKLTGGSAYGTVSVPGTFASVLTVGASAHRVNYRNYKGIPMAYNQGRNGVRANFSSVGPTLKGLMKPDVTAPGTNIGAAYSSADRSLAEKDFETLCLASTSYNGKTYYYVKSDGTSMAAPVVTGTIALWLQADPTLTTDRVKEIIAKTARHYDTTVSYPNNDYGYGDIDAYAGLLAVLGIDGISGLSHSIAKGATILPTADGRILVSFESETQRPVSVRIYSTDGRLLHSVTVPAHSSSATITLPAQHKGIVAVQADGYGSNLVRL